MIRVPSETFGSMMVQHGAKNRNLFNIEMYLRFNLGALQIRVPPILKILELEKNGSTTLRYISPEFKTVFKKFLG